MVFHTGSYEETERAAAYLAQRLRGGEVIAMYGDLGAGKTAFVRGLARALGIERHITSPTFTIVNEYEGRLPLYHFDIYRLSGEDELYDIGFEDYIGSGGVTVIEWAELAQGALPDRYIRVDIKKETEKGDNCRVIEIKTADNGRYIPFPEEEDEK